MINPWEEKNLIKQKNNCKNKNEFVINGITNDTNNTSCKKECEDIGRKWTKNCPICNKLQHYKNKRSFWNANKLKSICICCKNKGENNPFYGKKHTLQHKNKLSSIQRRCGSYRYKNTGGNPPKVNKVCRKCNVEFKTVISNKNVYCCYNCALKDNFGFKFNKMTKPEIEIENYLKINNIEYKYNYALYGKLYDFYIPSTNTLIEVDGIYWHGKHKNLEDLNDTQMKVRKNDEIKNRLANENGYTLIRIWEDEVKDVSKYLRK